MADSTITPLHKSKPSEGFGELIAIIVAILLGGLLGFFYGNSMWLAGGGAQDELLRLEKIIVQKEDLAKQHEQKGSQSNKVEAARLYAHIPIIETKMAEIETDLATLKKKNTEEGFSLAACVWETTKFLGEMFLRALKLLVIPLVVTSMVCGITSLGDVRHLGKIGTWTLVYYTATCAVAVLLGIVLVQLVQPGAIADDTFSYVSERVQSQENVTPVETLLNVFRGQPNQPHSGMIPANIILAASHTNVLALIIFAMLFGAMVTTIGKKGQIIIDLFEAANETIMKMVGLVMKVAPIGIFGLVAYNIAKNGGGEAFGEQLASIGKYVGVVVLGLSLHALFLNGLLTVLARRNPITYCYGLMRCLLTAATTASSSATLPVTMQCVQKNNGVSRKCSSFVLPLGATINMDGTALYEAVAVIFIAQSLGIELTTSALVIVFITATLAAIGAAGIPEAGLVTMVIVLTAVGLPIEGIGLILTIDWFLDRLRTTVNVLGDAIGAGIIDHYLEKDPAKE